MLALAAKAIYCVQDVYTEFFASELSGEEFNVPIYGEWWSDQRMSRFIDKAYSKNILYHKHEAQLE